MSIMRSDVILERLLQLHPKEIDLSLGRIEQLLEKLGNPQKQVPPVIHIAGTNGKGSVAAYCRAILEAAGKRVHVYTSPHLMHFHERIRLARAGGSSALVGEDELAGALAHCETVNGGAPITFFEITTAAAFVLFARHPADYLVLEVGLGGRLDATNVIDKPAVCVITPVSLDHPQFLGERIEQVAREKAGILKRGVACALAPQDDDVLSVIRTEAARRGATLFIADQDWQAYEQHGRLVYQDEQGLLDLPLPRLPGRHQIANAGTAIAALRLIKADRLDADIIASGLGDVDWPARMQRLGPGALYEGLPRDLEIWLDGGHNPAAAQVLARGMADLEERVSKPLMLICGMLNSKDAGGFFQEFADMAQMVVTLAIPREKNSISAHDLADIARGEGLPAEAVNDLRAALRLACERAPDARILICGSLYLAGHVLRLHAGEAV